MASILETTMLVCFGLSWPVNLMKAYRAGTTKGTSLFFIVLILLGYTAGTAAKLVSGQITYVLAESPGILPQQTPRQAEGRVNAVSHDAQKRMPAIS